jgi:hypothetical protein
LVQVIHLVIKGTPKQARAAAKERGIGLMNVRASGRWDETYADTHAQHAPVANWFHKDEEDMGGPPYPPGTLLHFS